MCHAGRLLKTSEHTTPEMFEFLKEAAKIFKLLSDREDLAAMVEHALALKLGRRSSRMRRRFESSHRRRRQRIFWTRNWCLLDIWKMGMDFQGIWLTLKVYIEGWLSKGFRSVNIG
jgi:hypothetical protein